jgi:hypothetical protein
MTDNPKSAIENPKWLDFAECSGEGGSSDQIISAED